ncbi:hypothetical protein F4821DRAFT_171313 [Hypoxylon rubiginosum]|uniref:Uncharacterized protein n=1 Tax=Hypoxylon rubiginosum TaxID=110542 RepID=A0ACC0CW92_9PEZI|nr:hypothetical protein F4821DRAFT_171313 [Hypoxylon rubiginosum]
MLFRLTALAALAATATASNATGPYALQITGKENADINGYAGACHSGAGIEALCYASGASLPPSVTQFYYNYTSYNTETGVPSQPGWITYLLTAGSTNGTITVPSAMQLDQSGWGTNVLTAQIFPGVESGTSVYQFENGTLYMYGGYDDSSFNATFPTPIPTLGNLTNFHLCYQFTGGYYYRSIAWVTTPPAHNPSCEPVDLTLVELS